MFKSVRVLLTTVLLIAGAYAVRELMAASPGRWLGGPSQSAIARAQASARSWGDPTRDLHVFAHRALRVSMCDTMVNYYAQHVPGASDIYEILHYKVSEIGMLDRGTMVLWSNRLTGRNTCGAMIGDTGGVNEGARWFFDPVLQRIFELGRAVAQMCIVRGEGAVQLQELSSLVEDTVRQIRNRELPPRVWPTVVTPRDLDGMTAMLEQLTGGVFDRCMRMLDAHEARRMAATRR